LLFDRADEVDTGVVDQNVDRAEACLGLTDGVGSLLGIGDVEREREARVRVALRQSCHWL